MQRKRDRNHDKQARKERESKDSYLTLKQFNFIYDRIQNARKSLKAQQEVIDKMEQKMLNVIEKKQVKERKKDIQLGDDKTI